MGRRAIVERSEGLVCSPIVQSDPRRLAGGRRKPGEGTLPKRLSFLLTRFTERFSGDLDVNLKPILTAIFASINPDQRNILLPKDFSGEREK